jgi:hypothetical protein
MDEGIDEDRHKEEEDDWQDEEAGGWNRDEDPVFDAARRGERKKPRARVKRRTEGVSR